MPDKDKKQYKKLSKELKQIKKRLGELEKRLEEYFAKIKEGFFCWFDKERECSWRCPANTSYKTGVSSYDPLKIKDWKLFRGECLFVKEAKEGKLEKEKITNFFKNK